jgi:hypothetical protein
MVFKKSLKEMNFVLTEYRKFCNKEINDSRIEYIKAIGENEVPQSTDVNDRKFPTAAPR